MTTLVGAYMIAAVIFFVCVGIHSLLSGDGR